MSSQEQLVTWLKSAYSMEQAQIKTLENHAKDARDLPEIHQHLERHIEQTRRHADRVKQCLELLGEKPSTAKAAMGNLVGAVQGASTGMFKDELVKNCLTDYSAEHFEIACYRSLIEAAEVTGQPEIARICGEILADEEAMAEWLQHRIPEVTRIMLEQVAHR